MIKLLGAALVLSVGVISAFGTVRYEKKRLSVLDGWIDLILYIRAQIDCYLTPLYEILSSSDPALMHACMSPEHETDLGAILRASSIYLDGNSKRLLESFIREIGSGYREEQVKLCDYYISALRTERAKVADELPTRMRLYAALCICVSLGTAILLW